VDRVIVTDTSNHNGCAGGVGGIPHLATVETPDRCEWSGIQTLISGDETVRDNLCGPLANPMPLWAVCLRE
jgi:hypothetical protein